MKVFSSINVFFILILELVIKRLVSWNNLIDVWIDSDRQGARGKINLFVGSSSLFQGFKLVKTV